jgi:hypothetical protein
MISAGVDQSIGFVDWNPANTVRPCLRPLDQRQRAPTAASRMMENG